MMGIEAVRDSQSTTTLIFTAPARRYLSRWETGSIGRGGALAGIIVCGVKAVKRLGIVCELEPRAMPYLDNQT
jgi:hypothetical protein